MRSHIARWAFPLMLAGLIGACASQPKAPAVDIAATTAAVDSLNNVFVAGVAARDTDAVTNIYASDAQVLPQGMPRADGHDAVRAFWVGMFKMPGLDLKITSSHPTVTEAGDMVIEVGTYAMKSTNAKGKPVEDVGKFVTIFKKEGGAWKIAVVAFNSDKPTTGM